MLCLIKHAEGELVANMYVNTYQLTVQDLYVLHKYLRVGKVIYVTCYIQCAHKVTHQYIIS